LRGTDFIDCVKELAKERGLHFRFDQTRGKGSHGTVWLGSRFTVLPDARKELKKGTLASMCRQLGIKPYDLRGR
jgi:mRNA interferase HicA